MGMSTQVIGLRDLDPDGEFYKMIAMIREIERLRAFIQEVRQFDPRLDCYASDLHGDACEALGLCRCCGQEECSNDS